MTQTAAIILAAGMGTRMRSDRPKVLHGLAGWPMVRHVLAALGPLAPARQVVVVAPGMEDVAAAVEPVPVAVQEAQLGTADAVRAARTALDGFEGTALVLYGDTPLVTAETLAAMVEARAADVAVVVLGFRPDDPGEYGRLVTAADGALERIVEARDATAGERAIDLCNSGVMAVAAPLLFELLDAVGNDNAKGEYYLTDIVGLVRARGDGAVIVEAPAEELLGVNSRAELAQAEATIQAGLRARAMAAGATLVAPEAVWFCPDTRLGRDVVIEPGVFFGPGVTVGDGVTIRAFSHIEGAEIADGATVGPFARLRPGARLGEGARVGNFVEVKNASLAAGAKASHLSYIGDADVGEGANIGAGTITCNYDGFSKFRTGIGAGAFIGSNTALVAPVSIGEGAIVGAGSTITVDVEDGALAVARGRQKNLPGWAEKLRTRMRARKGAGSGAGDKKGGKKGSGPAAGSGG